MARSKSSATHTQLRIFIHDDGQIVLDFEKTGTGDASNTDLSHRYLWGAAVDQILADEVVDDGMADDVHWTLTDHLNSVRDLAEYNSGTDTTSVVKHITYDAFGNVTSDSATTIGVLFKFTARPYDEDGELQNNLNRWYDLSTGRWMSTDPIGFSAGDLNLYRYVGSGPAARRDPRGTFIFNCVNPLDWAACSAKCVKVAGIGGVWTLVSCKTLFPSNTVCQLRQCVCACDYLLMLGVRTPGRPGWWTCTYTKIGALPRPPITKAFPGACPVVALGKC